MMIDQRDFIPKTLSKQWLKGVQTESFDAAIVGSTTNEVRGIEINDYPMSANLARWRA